MMRVARVLAPLVVVGVIFSLALAAEINRVELVPGDGGSKHHFGISSVLEGETAVIGSMHTSNSGAVYVFERGDGGWAQSQQLTDGVSGNWFGSELAIDADTLVVAAANDSTDGPSYGTVYVYVRGSEGWELQQRLSAADAQSHDYFGSSVSIDSDTVVVGCTSHDTVEYGEGAAYVFVRSGTTWTQQAQLIASDGKTADSFGESVSVSGDTIVVGAQASDDHGPGSGKAYMYVRSGTDWSEQQILSPSDLGPEDIFGVEVDLDGDRALIGAYADDDDGVSSGTVYYYTRSGTTWTLQQQVHSPTAEAYRYFGMSVDVFGDRMVVGEPGYDAGATSTGRANYYELSGDTWTYVRSVVPSSYSENDNWGRSVAISEKAVIVAGSTADAHGTDSGGAWILDEAPVLQVAVAAMIPTQVTVVVGEGPFKKKAPTPGLWAKGTLDTGPDPVNLGVPGSIYVGDAKYRISGLTVGKDERTWTYDEGEITFVVKMPKNGGSRCTFKLHVDADLREDVNPDGDVFLGYTSKELEASVDVPMNDGKFKLSKDPLAFGESLLHCVKASGKLKGAQKDSFTLKIRFGADGRPPSDAPEVIVGFGEMFEEVLDVGAFKLKKSKWIYTNKRAEGVTKAVFDFAKGNAVIKASKCSLGEFADGATPLTIMVGIDEELHAVEVRAIVKRRKLKY
jgi:hypothetical protein